MASVRGKNTRHRISSLRYPVVLLRPVPVTTTAERDSACGSSTPYTCGMTRYRAGARSFPHTSGKLAYAVSSGRIPRIGARVLTPLGDNAWRLGIAFYPYYSYRGVPPR
jgi:hypothetical protein